MATEHEKKSYEEKATADKVRYLKVCLTSRFFICSVRSLFQDCALVNARVVSHLEESWSVDLANAAYIRRHQYAAGWTGGCGGGEVEGRSAKEIEVWIWPSSS